MKMTASPKERRLDAIEVHLTPKEWAVRLAQEMRSQPSEADFLRVVADEPYREWPWVKPFFKLCEQAEARYPGNRPENIRARNQSAGRLRTEFHALKKLIYKANEIIKSKAETIRLKTGLKLSNLHTLILQDAMSRTARKIAEWVRLTTGAPADEERQLMLKEVAGYTELGLPPNRPFLLLVEDWVDELTMLLTDVFLHKAAVREIQDKYFDGHPVLFCDAESNLLETIKSLEYAASMFNEYSAISGDLFRSDSGPEGHAEEPPAILDESKVHLAIDIGFLRLRAEEFLVDYVANEWVKETMDDARADILQETGEHEGHIWRAFRERVKS
jgi:hypothetical protein